MNFTDLIKDELNVSITENGARGYAYTKSDLVDFNFKIASYRKKSENDIIVDFKKAWYENKELALKYLFYARDIREGLGERRLFRACIREVVNDLDTRVFDWIMEYGRADDLFVFIDTKLEYDLYEYVNTQLMKDAEAMVQGKPCSLLAKWMPSINTSSRDTKELAKRFIKAFHISEKAYRKTLSKLRGYIDVLEKKLCANKWSEVDYEKVPSQANLKYMNSFLKHDNDRRREYLDKLEKGEAKVNAATNFPHDIVHKYHTDGWNRDVKAYDSLLEGMWKALPNYIEGKHNVLVVRDGSGSMTTPVGNSSVSAEDVSTALSVYFAERNSGEYKDKFITFSARPKFIDLSKYETLHDKVERCYKEDEVANTNIKAVFDLILNVAKSNNLKQEDIPTILVISDMEFDEATYMNPNERLFGGIAKKYEECGYKLPKLVFWNVNSRTGTIPVTQNEEGVILVSGFSAAITKMVLSNEVDPYKALVNILMGERYKQVTLTV